MSELSPIEQRVLGALMEKQTTVPGTYPMTLNGLRTACNQTSSRDPVTDHDHQEIEECLRELKDRELVRFVWAGRGSRTLKYHQRLDEHLGLGEDEKALITVLLLRGPQTAGELRTRTERLYPFDDKQAVTEALTRLAERDLVQMLERRPGQHDHRWVHLLGPTPGVEEPDEPTPEVDREAFLSGGTAERDARVLASYDGIAEAYADVDDQRWNERLFDRWLLERIGSRTFGPVADVGCGPGGSTALLTEAGAEVTGFDISPAMVAAARDRHPDLHFEVADLHRLLRPRTAEAWAAIIAWQALCHLAPSELPGALAALTRVLAPGGQLALALHIGDEVRPLTELFDQPVELDLVLHDQDEVLSAIAAAGLLIEEWYVRGPQGDDADTCLYVLAHLPWG